MKKIKLIAFLFVAAIASSCSSSDDSEAVNPAVDSTDYFNHSSNGQVVAISQWTAIRTEDHFEVLGQTALNSSMYLSFNKYGDLERAGTTSVPGSGTPWRNSAYDFSQNTFDFQILGIDEVNKVIKLSYSGKVYEDEHDITDSDFETVAGTVNVHYMDMTPEVAGTGFSAKIAGTDWYGVKMYTTNNGEISNMKMVYNNDDKNQLSVYLNKFDTAVGTYAFTANSSNNKVTYSVYDTTTKEYVDYKCAGTFTLTEKRELSTGITLFAGTFNLTATHPVTNAVVQITAGTFKEISTY